MPAFLPDRPAAEIETGDLGMYLHIGDVTVDLDSSSDDADDQADNLDRCARVLADLADDLARAQRAVSAARAMLGERCDSCRGYGGHEHPRTECWYECGHCDGRGRIPTPQESAA